MSAPTSPAAITALSAGAMSAIVRDLVEEFRRATGIPTTVAFTRSGLVRDRVQSGEQVDVVITTRPALARLVELGKVLPDSVVALASSGIGVAVRIGAARPEIDTTTAFTHTLRRATSIAYADPATGSPSGNYLMALFDRLGLSAELAPRTRLVGAAGGHAVVVCEMVAAGGAEIGFQQISEILPVRGVDLLGPLPPELQHLTTFSAAVGAGAENPDAARRLIALMSSAVAAPVIRAQGMEPA